jgi:hypothetical protein
MGRRGLVVAFFGRSVGTKFLKMKNSENRESPQLRSCLQVFHEKRLFYTSNAWLFRLNPEFGSKSGAVYVNLAIQGSGVSARDDRDRTCTI